MKIRMITLYAGPAGVMEGGKEYDVSPAVAKQLVEGRFAVAVGKEPAPVVVQREEQIETAVPDIAVEMEVRPAPTVVKRERKVVSRA